MKRSRIIPILFGLMVLATAVKETAFARSTATAPRRPISVGTQDGCPLIFPAGPVAVAPNQPAVPNQSTVGIINALCDVTLDFVGCGFMPSAVSLGCDTNGDGLSDVSIPLKDIKLINSLFF